MTRHLTARLPRWTKNIAFYRETDNDKIKG